MPDKITVNIVRFQAYLEVDDNTGVRGDNNIRAIALSNFHMNFSLNEVPTATASVALGDSVSMAQARDNIDIDYSMYRSNVTWLQSQLDARTDYLPARVYLRVFHPELATDNWPDGFQLIFEGYIVDSSEAMYGFGEGQAPQLVLTMLHWASDMDASSAISSISHPSNEGDLTYRLMASQMRNTTNTPTTTPDKILLYQAYAANAINSVTIQEDFWGKGIFPLLEKILENSSKQVYTILQCFPGTVSNDPWAFTALKRFEGYSGEGTGFVRTSQWYRPLSINAASAQDSIIPSSIAQYINKLTMESMKSTSVWGKLSMFASLFMFAIVPRISSVIVAPFYLGCRQTYPVRLDGISITNTTKTLLRGIKAVTVAANAIVCNTNFGSGGNRDSSNANYSPRQLSLPLLGGCYTPDPDKRGTILIRSAPPWLQQSQVIGGRADVSMKSLGNKYLQVQSSDQTRGDGSGVPLDVSVQNVNDLLSRLAHWHYLNETLKGRYVTLQTRLRLDVGPGSTVIFSVQRGKTANTDMEYIGHVLKVTVALDGVNSTAYTQYQLGGIRKRNKNDLNAYSSPEHPIYKGDPFVGAPLSDVFMFGAIF